LAQSGASRRDRSHAPIPILERYRPLGARKDRPRSDACLHRRSVKFRIFVYFNLRTADLDSRHEVFEKHIRGLAPTPLAELLRAPDPVPASPRDARV
jgi:hypothetical protein